MASKGTEISFHRKALGPSTLAGFMLPSSCWKSMEVMKSSGFQVHTPTHSSGFPGQLPSSMQGSSSSSMQNSWPRASWMRVELMSQVPALPSTWKGPNLPLFKFFGSEIKARHASMVFSAGVTAGQGSSPKLSSTICLQVTLNGASAKSSPCFQFIWSHLETIL